MGETQVEENNSIVPLGDLKGGVEFVNVDFKYPGSDKWILKDFTLTVKPGESIAFVGESGAGKSTVLNLLIGFIPPTNGKVLIDRINMVNLDINEYRHQIAVVPQNTILFSGTIASNIKLAGEEQISDGQMREAADTAQAREVYRRKAGGLRQPGGAGRQQCFRRTKAASGDRPGNRQKTRRSICLTTAFRRWIIRRTRR